MTEATWGDAASPDIDWRMSAALENVPRGDGNLAEVTSLRNAVQAWLALDAHHRAAATLTPERPVMLGGAATETFAGEGIGALAERLRQDGATVAPIAPGPDAAG